MPEGKQNRLAKEKSPYLLEHSTNPVDWWSWGEEAFAKARNDSKPIFLSVGYSTCHWCHVMRRESFEDSKTAAFINKNFIPIKVDREERPEVDAYYMSAVNAMTGGGGWPLSVFLTPDLKPFFGGTYYPPEPRYGMPSFMQVLEFVSNLWKDRREEVVSNTRQVLHAISAVEPKGRSELTKALLDEGYSTLVSSFDPENGGFGGAPKFPLPGALAFLLRYHRRTGNELALRAVQKTLDRMMAGGIRDHVGGGFHRYSTDRVWLVPHFEKMLYDNALLAKVYAEAYQLTRKGEYAEVVRETLSWIRNEMKDKGGGFYSAQDADTSEGEGTYYTWTPDEVEDAAGKAYGSTFSRFYGVTKTGNFEGRTILHLEPDFAPTEAEAEELAGAKKALYRARSKRPRPAIDTKVLTSWNGLAISAFGFASAVLDEPLFADEAAGAARFLLKTLDNEGMLLRRYAGGEAALEGTLEDYAFLVQGLLDLFEATSEPKWLEDAIRLTKSMIGVLEDSQGGGFYLTASEEPARLKESYDGPTPSGNSVAALNLIRLGELTGRSSYLEAAKRTLNAFAGEIERQPSAHAVMLQGLDLILNGAKEIVISAPTAKAASEMVAAVYGRFVPDKVVIAATPENYLHLSKVSTLLEGRKPGRQARAFVCHNSVCNLPADSLEALRAQLAS
jgi:uncharacterized protein YyaL (SSP411 family)